MQWENFDYDLVIDILGGYAFHGTEILYTNTSVHCLEFEFAVRECYVLILIFLHVDGCSYQHTKYHKRKSTSNFLVMIW